LFKISNNLYEILKTTKLPDHYIAIHIRFLNALEKREKGYKCNLSEDEKKYLIDKCINIIELIKNQIKEQIVIFSDSITFLKIINDKGYYSLDYQYVGNIKYNTDIRIHDKVFLDLFTIANATKIYAIRGKYLYNSMFPEYASIIGGKEFKIINI
jgi:hypothetical protein